jgi:DNA-binding HxlR family transcriptional regulator
LPCRWRCGEPWSWSRPIFAVPRLLHLLEDVALRNHELQSAIEEVFPKMLTQTLRGMERDGLITRLVRRASPRRVEYELAEMSKSVIAPIRALCH